MHIARVFSARHVGRRRIGTFAAAALLILAVVVPADAVGPSVSAFGDAARLTDLIARASDQRAAFSRLTPREQQSVLDYTALAYVTTEQSLVGRAPSAAETLQSAAAVTCWTWTWGRDAHNVAGVLLWQFTQEIDWCGNGTTITNTPFRKVTGTPKFLWWSYQGLVADSTGGGMGSSTYRSYVEGWFSYRPIYPWMNQDDYPWLDMTAHANGAGTGSGGG